ncbi:hypothetical protein EPR50_G00061240 [Perca flavescens]|uniref:Ig-like domain-containing protein n=1 Tax=Perca flavescens TaxID=8167 RepID=A0A484D7P8_PERFV|nr:hypothetical protein EPR50_G00061240 [Perca flavescens]
MAAALNFLLVACLLQGALCGEFEAFIPKNIEVLSGSCVTIPCSFDIKAKHESNLDNTSDPPSPTLTPSTLKVKEGDSVSLSCSAPAPCLSHPPNLTWTPGLGGSEETLQDNQDQTKVKISNVTFTASHLHHKNISCTAVYSKQDGSTESSVSTSLTAYISFAPQILPSSDCSKAAAQLNCSCETLGNPSPTLQWYLDGLPVNHSDRFAISYEPLDDTGLRSIITVNQPQERDLAPLLCHSSNSLGSATQRFYVYSLELQTSAESQECSGRVPWPFFIVTVGVLTAALILCALLFAIRAQRTGCCNPSKTPCSGDTSTAVMSRGFSETENKVSTTTEEDIYVNTNMMRMSNVPFTHRGHQEVASTSSEKKNEEGSDVIYSSVIWKSKEKKKKKKMKKGEGSGGRNPSGSSYLEEERCKEGGTCRNYVSDALEMGSLYDTVGTGKDAEKTMYSEYAQVNFRDA